MSAFWTVHSDLPREGPGTPDDVHWAAGVSGCGTDAKICDVACGPGADIATWLEVAPQGHVTAVERHAPFVARIPPDPRVTVITGDMAKLQGQFDLIWCAGAVYFLGVEKALSIWRDHLRPGGHIAFSEPCYFTQTPSPGAQAFWGGHPVIQASGIADQIRAAGFETLATRPVSDAGWEAYYKPMEARLQRLAQGADAELRAAITEHETEIEGWRANRSETGYLLSVVRPE